MYNEHDLYNIPWHVIKANILMKIVSWETAQEEIEEDQVSRELKDFVWIYYVDAGDVSGEYMIPIYEEHMSIWGIDQSDLYQAAKENLLRKQFILRKLEPLSGEVVSDGTEKEGTLASAYYFTTVEKCCAASAIIFRELLSGIADRLGSSLFITIKDEDTLYLFPTIAERTDDDNTRVQESAGSESAVSRYVYLFDKDKRKLFSGRKVE